MLEYQGQISIPVITTRRLVYVSIVFSYSLAYDATNVTNNDNLATAISCQSQIMVRKSSVESIG